MTEKWLTSMFLLKKKKKIKFNTLNSQDNLELTNSSQWCVSMWEYIDGGCNKSWGSSLNGRICYVVNHELTKCNAFHSYNGLLKSIINHEDTLNMKNLIIIQVIKILINTSTILSKKNIHTSTKLYIFFPSTQSLRAFKMHM